MKFLSYLLVAALSFGAAFYLATGKPAGDPLDFSNVELPDDSDDVQGDSTTYTTYYDQLTDTQKRMYDAYLEKVRTMDDSFITLENISLKYFQENAMIISKAVLHDHPEYFWALTGYSYSYSRARFATDCTVKWYPMFYDFVTPMYNKDAKAKELDAAVKKVAELARAHSSDDFDRVIFVHDYLTEHAYYDHDGLKEYYKTDHDPSCEYIFTAYGCLVDGKTVCSGYAKAFQLVMWELGYDCTYVTGDAGEAHGWNVIYLDGEGYYVDVTWDDPDFEENEPLYNYALITSEALGRTHTVDDAFDIPYCTATKYSYFHHEGYFSPTYNFSAASEILSRQVGEDAVHIQFGSLSELKKAYDDLIQGGKSRKIPGLKSYTSCTYNEDHYTLTLMKK